MRHLEGPVHIDAACTASGDLAQADGLHERACEMAAAAGLSLFDDGRGLVLSDGTMSLRGDLTRMAGRATSGAVHRELLVKAAKVKRSVASSGGGAGDDSAAKAASVSNAGAPAGAAPTPSAAASAGPTLAVPAPLVAIDATAGLGEDSLLLAAAGFEVHLFERNPVIAALLVDSVNRARADARLHDAASRMHVHVGDSIAALTSIADASASSSTFGLSAEPRTASGPSVKFNAAPGEPAVVDAAPSEPAVEDAAPGEPAVENAAPSEPAVMDAAPSEPAVMDAAPGEPAVVDAAPASFFAPGVPSVLPAPDVVFLDPMFPARQKSSAVKKKLQLLQRLETPCDDEAALLDAALSARPRKVVVKRPAKGPYLAQRKPAYSLSGKAVRFDCYVR